VLYAKDESTASDRLNQTAVTQPALFAVEYALAQLWLSCGVTPSAYFGHSIGEYVAACQAGVLKLEDALRLVALRGKLIQSTAPGAMLAIRIAESDLVPLLTRDLDLAAVNGSQQCVVSGPTIKINAFEKSLTERGIVCKRLPVSHAFHSNLMDPVLDEFRTAVAAIPRQPPNSRFISCVTGTWITAEQAIDPAYWAEHIRRTVRCADGIRTLAADGAALLEVGPGTTLTNLARSASDAVVPSLPRGDGARSILEALGRLWTLGVTVDWQQLHVGDARRRIALPTYPFEHQRFWIEPPATSPALKQSLKTAEPPSPLPQGPEKDEQKPSGFRISGHDRPEILAFFAALSGVDAQRIDPKATFFELGFDSLGLTQAVVQIQKRFGVKVTFRQLLAELPTIETLAEYVEQHRVATPEAASKSTPAVHSESESPQGFGALAPVDRSGDAGWTRRQRRFIADLIERTTRRTARSKEHVQHFRGVHADPRTVSGFTKLWKEMVYPIVVDRSAGSTLWDIDGNEYIDLLNGFGPDLFGHSPPFIVNAVAAQLRSGYEVGPQSPLAGEVAQLICEMTGMERASFVCTGSEAVQAALRAARTVTGRDLVVLFARDYHGNFDEVLVRPHVGSATPSAPGIPASAVGNVLVLDYGTDAALATIRERAHEVAAVLVEPVQSRRPEWQPRDFLHEVRRITHDAGAALIFDEVITGFRLQPGGAQAFYGVAADLATYGKVIGGGMPFGVVAGRGAFMDAFDGGIWQFGDDSAPEAGRTFFAGTFVRHPLALAAAKAALAHLRDAGPTLQSELNAKTDRLVAELNTVCVRSGVPMQVVNGGSVMFFRVLDGSKAASLLFYLLREKGIYILEGFPSYLSTAHSEADLRRIADTFRISVGEMFDAGFFGSALEVKAEPSRNGVAGTGRSAPLTEAQRELWLAAQMGSDASCAYNESCHLRLSGPLNLEVFRKSVQALVDRHESLRATISADGEWQRFADRLDIEVPVVEISDEPHLAASLENEDRQTFDLEHGPLIRCRLFRIGPTQHVFSLTAHHIVCDGWAYDILLRDLAAIYSASIAGESPALTPAASFAEYAHRQSRWLHSPESDAIDAWWRLRFADPPEVVELPTDRPRPAERSYRGARLTGSLGPDLSRAVRRVACQLGRTPYAVLFAAYQTLIHRLSGADEFAVGIPTAGQALEGQPTLVGHCVHFLPIRGRSTGPFADYAAALHASLVDAFDHQRFTYARLIRLLALPREANRSPILSATFNLDPEVKGLDFAGLSCSVAKNPKHFVNFDLHWNLVEQGDEFLVECEYAIDLFDSSTIDRWLDQYRTLLTAAIHDPTQSIDRLPLMTASERERVLVQWNATATPYPANRCVHQLFEEQASRSPDSIALESNGSAINYGDLNRRANRLASRLRAAGVERDSIVAVCGERSIDVIVGLLGVLKAGGAYLPLNPHDPLPRLKQLLADADVRIVLTDRKLDVPGEVISLNETFAGDDSGLPNINEPDDLAYVMYTSGSTGVPKGVAVPHRSIARLLFGVDYASFGPDRVIGQLAPLAFDASTFEIWGALLHGGRCALYPGRAPSPAELSAFLSRHRVDTLFLTTGLFNTVIDADTRALIGVRQLLTGGEAVSVAHVRKALSTLSDTSLVHVYGPTETTTFATSWALPRDIDAAAATLPIGRPIGNTTCLVVDARNEPVPIGVIGELLIGGPGVARGYLKRPEATAERFVEFACQRVYRTGDRVRWRPDGTLEFVGRSDRQVKVRGFRIEPGEIEAALARLPEVGAAAVVPVADSIGGMKLVAYVAPTEPSRTLTPDAVRSALRTTLPEFMWPAHIVPLSRLPMSPTGKLDRQALPPPIIDATLTHEFIEPRDETERKLAELWREVLGVGRVGIHDDFFTLGGHSLLAARLFARMRERHRWELPLAKMFRTPTIAGLAEALRGEAAATPISLLVPLRLGGMRTPLFCVPGVGSHVFTFRELAERLPADRPILGLEARGMDGREPPHTLIEPMAAEYIAEIRRQHPKGPYHLAGYSLGGLVVFEMARQLAALGAPVGIIAILDAHAPGHPRRLPALKRLQIHGSKFAALSWRERRTYLAERFSNRLGRSDQRSDYEAQVRGAADLSPSTRGVIEAHLGALHHYRPEPYPGRVQLFRSREQEAWSEMYVPDYTMGWGELVEGGLDLYWVPGGHLEMFHPAAVETLTRQLGELLRNAP
jgi:amino acid adenylation domain-containing protein